MPTIQEVRAKYPQYSDLNDDQLLDGLHRKFYSDMSREDFNKRMGVQKPQTGNLAAAAEGVGQGITFGFGDEIEGAVRGGIDALTSDKSFSQAYDERLAGARERQKTARDTNPLAYYGGEIGSAVAVPFTVGPRLAAGAARVLPEAVTGAARAAGFGQVAANAGAGLGARTWAGVREGAAYGALHGFGHGEGGAVERGENAMLGAGTGAVIGAAAPAVIDTANAMIRGVRGFVKPERVAAEKYVDALWRDLSPNGIRSGGDVRPILDRHQKSLQDARQIKPDAWSMDMAGVNTRGLVRAAANQQSPGAQRINSRLDARQAKQWQRIEDDLADTLSVDGRSFYESTEALAKTRAQNAAPAFDNAYNAQWNVKPDDDLAKFLTDRSYMRRLVEKADESIQGMTGESPAAVRPWEFLHRVKMEIDREIGRLKRGQQDSKANWTLRDLVQLKNEFKGLVDKHNPAFGKALKQYGDESSLINAAEEGFEEGLKRAPELIAKDIKAMSPQEADLYRLGFSRSVIDQVRRGNKMNDRTKSVFSSPDMDLRLKAVFPDTKSYAAFRRRVALEERMSKSRNAIQGGSMSDKNLVQAEEAGQPGRAAMAVAETGYNVATGRWVSAMQSLSRHVSRFTGLTPDAANEIIKLAMAKGGAKSIAGWDKAIANAERNPQLRAQFVQDILAAAGATTGEVNDQKGGPTRVTVGRPDHWPKTNQSGTP